jgi:hypothetical protein
MVLGAKKMRRTATGDSRSFVSMPFTNISKPAAMRYRSLTQDFSEPTTEPIRAGLRGLHR